MQRLHRTLDCAPRLVVMRRDQLRFHHAAATAHSQREKCKLSAYPANQNLNRTVAALAALSHLAVFRSHTGISVRRTFGGCY